MQARNIQICKVDKENLYVLDENSTLEKMKENKSMEFAVHKVIQLVVDGRNVLKGIITDVDYESDNIDDYIKTKYMSLTCDEHTDERVLYETAKAILSSGGIYLLPVVDSEGKLLFAYQECFGLNAWFFGELNRFDFFDVIALYEKEKRREKNLYICSNLGSHDKSVAIDEIGDLEKDAFVCIGFNEDYMARKAVDECIKNNVRYKSTIYQKIDRVARYYDVDVIARKVLLKLAQENGKYFDHGDFQTIFQAIKQTRYITGDYVEIGTYRGDSAKAALEYICQSGINRRCFFLDTFEGFNYSAAETSTDSFWAGTHCDTSISLVRKRLKNYDNFSCVKCNIITDEIPEMINDIVVCNIDVDMQEATAVALEKVKGKIVSGGIIIAEDFGHTPNLIGGQYSIVEFAEKYADEFISIYGSGSQLILIKK